MGVDEDDELEDGVWLDVASNCCVPFDGDWRPPFIIDCWLNKDWGDRIGEDDQGKWWPMWFELLVLFSRQLVAVLADDDVDVDDDVEFGEFNLLFRSFDVEPLLLEEDEFIHVFWIFDAFEEVFAVEFCVVLLPEE